MHEMYVQLFRRFFFLAGEVGRTSGPRILHNYCTGGTAPAVNDSKLTSENNSGTLISNTIILLPTRGKRLIWAMNC